MKQNKTSLSIAVGTSLLSGFAVTNVQAEMNGAAEANPFEITELSSGYMQVAEADAGKETKKMEGSCGEGKCGAGMAAPKVKEGACAGMKKAKEGSCGDMKNAKGKMKEGACGDMKKAKGKMKEGACGDMKKSEGKMKEGACGDMKKAK